MQNIFWLIPGRLAGRAGPAREPWSLEDLRAGGFGAILNVSEIEPSAFDHERAQLDVAWIPLPNSYPATTETERACLQILPKAGEFVRSHLDAGRSVLVHCAWGRDRTGLVLAYHLACSTGLAPKEAIAEVRKVRPLALSAAGWEEMAERVIARLLRT